MSVVTEVGVVRFEGGRGTQAMDNERGSEAGKTILWGPRAPQPAEGHFLKTP